MGRSFTIMNITCEAPFILLLIVNLKK
jgi:hypothetical protein